MSGGETYEWTQKDNSLTVSFPVPSGTHKRDIALEVSSTWLEAGIRAATTSTIDGPPPVQVIVRGKLHNAVAEKKTHLQVKNGQATITLHKLYKGQWPALFLPVEFQPEGGGVGAAPVKFRALWEYVPQEEGELGFSAGDIVNVVQQDESGWWTGQVHGVIGVFPSNYLDETPLPAEAAPASEAQQPPPSSEPDSSTPHHVPHMVPQHATPAFGNELTNRLKARQSVYNESNAGGPAPANPPMHAGGGARGGPGFSPGPARGGVGIGGGRGFPPGSPHGTMRGGGGRGGAMMPRGAPRMRGRAGFPGVSSLNRSQSLASVHHSQPGGPGPARGGGFVPRSAGVDHVARGTQLQRNASVDLNQLSSSGGRLSQNAGLSSQHAYATPPPPTAQRRVVEPPATSPIAPKTQEPPPVPNNHFVVVQDYQAEGDGELSLVYGELIVVDTQDESGWWEGSDPRGAQGWFPADFVQPAASPAQSECAAAVDEALADALATKSTGTRLATPRRAARTGRRLPSRTGRRLGATVQTKDTTEESNRLHTTSKAALALATAEGTTRSRGFTSAASPVESGGGGGNRARAGSNLVAMEAAAALNARRSVNLTCSPFDAPTPDRSARQSMPDARRSPLRPTPGIRAGGGSGLRHQQAPATAAAAGAAPPPRPVRHSVLHSTPPQISSTPTHTPTPAEKPRSAARSPQPVQPPPASRGGPPPVSRALKPTSPALGASASPSPPTPAAAPPSVDPVPPPIQLVRPPPPGVKSTPPPHVTAGAGAANSSALTGSGGRSSSAGWPSSLPPWPEFSATVERIFAEVATLDHGSVHEAAAVSRGDASHWCVAAVSAHGGDTLSLGVEQVGEFSLQECVQPFVLALSGADESDLAEVVDTLPNTLAASALQLSPNGKPVNAFTTPGALLTSALWDDPEEPRSPTQRIRAALRSLQLLAGGRHVGCDLPSLMAAQRDCDRYRAAAAWLADTRYMYSADALRAETFCRQLASVRVDALTLATMASTLANGGRCPIANINEQVVPESAVEVTVSNMLKFGCNSASSRLSKTMPFAKKTGISGATMVVIPGVLGLAMYSPLLDENENSVRALTFLQKLHTALS
eukprot:CAMPEP_0174234418 /NCGR_PEP_ID=MMETSP0417-20130205/4176_1 /TAXON_ID=242541 /ORGANISM="Mayorella sp, Strain BSH-02190019" /LENGTH=1098 /DNA_ID=CAMNT_0015312779 /DNA_START=26 /DNA_END=3322 /DNA_ORIENTATION=+